MRVVQPAYKFIIYLAFQNTRIHSLKTIQSYANSLYDYFSFLEANKLDWIPASTDSQVSNVELYRRWSISLSGNEALSPSTINTRLAAIKSFYEYCYNKGAISSLPWDESVRYTKHDANSFMRHTRTTNKLDTSGLRIKHFKKPPKVLTLEQAKKLISAITNQTHLLMVKLALTTGLRRDEISSFQRDLIYKPSSQQMGKRLPIDLTPLPGKQRTKGNRPRTIYVPAPLMSELFEYIRWGESVKNHRRSIGDDRNKLFLTRQGREFSESTFNTLLNKLTLSGKIDFKVTPHMLRHTFATVELYAESELSEMAYALSWVRDRLGHSSIQTTMVYIHCLEQLQDKELHQYQNELLELMVA